MFARLGTRLRRACAAVVCLLSAAIGCDDGPPIAAETRAGGDSTPGTGVKRDAAGYPIPTGDEPPGTGLNLVLGSERPAKLYVPKSYDPRTPAPLVLILHGYGVSGAIESFYLSMTQEADRLGFVYASPDGTADAAGRRFWNATEACCDYGGTGVDDEAYLIGLLDDVSRSFNIDQKRIHVLGHSNGGFMAYRLACAHAARLASIGVLAGAMPFDSSSCKPTEPVSVLHVHGTADATILYGGGKMPAARAAYPGAVESHAFWRARNGCAGAPALGDSVDLDAGVAGAETQCRPATGCSAGTELWTMEGSSHVPQINPQFAPAALTWLLNHPKP